MKNPVIKKLLAYVLVGAMTISTPITVAAAEHSVIADAYSVDQSGDSSKPNSKPESKPDSDPNSKPDSDPNTKPDSDPNSKPNTNPNTKPDSDPTSGPIKPEIVLDIMGLVLDKTELMLEKDADVATSDRIQARVLFTDYNPDNEVMVLAADNEEREYVNKYLKWEVTPETTVSTDYYTDVDGNEDRSMLNVTAENGGVATITAWLDTNANGVCDDDEFSDSATVTVKEYISSADQIEFKLPETMYVKHTYNLNDFVTFPTSAKGEKMVFYAKGDYAKQATITSDGILTIKKNVGDITIVAATEKAITLEATAKVSEGNPAKSITADKTVTLDLGKQANLTKDVKATLVGKNSGACTDAVSWTVKNAKIATVEYKNVYDPYDETSTYEAVITAKDIGSTTVTGVTSSGKKVNIKVTVNATPDKIELAYAGRLTDENKATIYTGKKPQLSVVSYSDYDTVIPNGKTKYVWTATATGFEKNKKATVKNGKVTPHYILADENKPGSVKVKAAIKNGKSTPEFEFTVKQVVFDSGSGKVMAGSQELKKTKPFNEVCVGKPVNYTGVATLASGYESLIPADEISEALDWSASGAGTVSDTGLVTATKGGNIKLNLSYVIKNKGKFKLETKKYTVVSKQKATSLVFKKDVLAVAAGSKAAAKVTVDIKQQLPKGAKDTIQWKVLSAGATENASMNVKPDKKTATDKKLVLDLSSYKAGTVVKVGAFTDGGVAAYAYIYVVPSVGAPAVASKTAAIKVGGNTKISTSLALTAKNKVYESEPVTYSVDKKGVSFVSVASDGTVYGLAPGKAKVTITSASGKKATVTVTVTE